MKKYKMTTLIVLLFAILFSVFSASLAWFVNTKIISPNLSFSAGAPSEYNLYKVTCENDTSEQKVSKVDTVGIAGFDIYDLQFGKINNLSLLEHSNYVYYVVEVPKEDGGLISLGVSYGDTDSDGEHFKIYVPLKGASGDIQYNTDGTVKTELFSEQTPLEQIKAIETDNSSTFVSFTYALSNTSPYEYENIEAIEAIFDEKEPLSMDAVDENNNPIPYELTHDVGSVVGDFYYVYIRLEPNVSLYKHFIEHLWNNMPYFLTYEIRATLSVRSQTP